MRSEPHVLAERTELEALEDSGGVGGWDRRRAMMSSVASFKTDSGVPSVSSAAILIESPSRSGTASDASLSPDIASI